VEFELPNLMQKRKVVSKPSAKTWHIKRHVEALFSPNPAKK